MMLKKLYPIYFLGATWSFILTISILSHSQDDLSPPLYWAIFALYCLLVGLFGCSRRVDLVGASIFLNAFLVVGIFFESKLTEWHVLAGIYTGFLVVCYGIFYLQWEEGLKKQPKAIALETTNPIKRELRFRIEI